MGPLELKNGLTEHRTPVLVLDQALSLLRSASAQQWLRGISAGLPLVATLLGLYATEHVLRMRLPLAVFALLCALAYWARFRGLSSLARELASTLSPRAALGERASSLGAFNTAMVAGIGSWFWALGLVAAAQSSFTLLLVCFPLLCARGAFAPSLLARSACAPESGLRALARASADTRGQRHLFLGVELLALFGLLVLFGNLYALTALALLVASSLLGLDVGFVTALIAPDNEIVPLLLLGLAALLLEPLRAAISALAFQSARERWEGADLRAAIDALAPKPAARRASLLALLLLSAPVLVHAQPAASADAAANADAAPSDTRPRADLAASADAAASDTVARQKARAILERGEFLPSASDSADGAWGKWLEERVRERELSDRDASMPPRFELRLPPSVLLFGSFVLMLAVCFWLTRSLRSHKARVVAAGRGSIVPEASTQRIAEAATLAAQEHYEQGMRSLYATCLSALGRPDATHTQTNGQVLQRIAPAPLRAAFESFTSMLEPCRYGRQRATREDFERARVLTDQILREAAQP